MVLLKVNLMSHVAEADRTKERLAEILAERSLTFLYPLSSIQSSLWKHLSMDPNPTSFYKWVKDNMDEEHQKNPDFISALATVVIKYIAQVIKFTISDCEEYLIKLLL